MSEPGAKAVLHKYLQTARDTMAWKVADLSEYDVRRPLTPSGTNLLGLVKHLAGVEAGYLGEVFGRPYTKGPSWVLDPQSATDPNVDMWVPAEESRAWVLEFSADVHAHGDATIDALDLETPGEVTWWPAERRQVTLHTILTHLIAEFHRHAGHADILREMLDGSVGLRPDNDNIPPLEGEQWREHYDAVERAARAAERRTE
ncbi:DinB family protein [Spiractinospora alimapuensis]|uniref:DinB family protein n=1 Tax=Spiractinospora alimapuensis TaxID=2820884 RepID=UPI001F3D4F25|nr:DinB family protein [Spiractinospora alimapuensis]QVQ52750.1 DinB family protein [Spiractinospora alimapuensis]